jgi:hypothetical protein
MKDDQLDKMLRELPREQVTNDFTRRVLSGATEVGVAGSSTAGRRRTVRLPAWGIAAAAAALLLVPAGIWIFDASQRAALTKEITALRTEHGRLTGELRALRQQMGAAQPVIYLGGDDRVDYVLDLKRLVREQLDGAVRSPAAQPRPPRQPHLPVSFEGGSI